MTAARPLPFPPGRILAEWRRQLTWQEPCTLWIGYLRLQRVEALTRIARESLLDAVQRSVFRVLALMPARPTAGATSAEARGTDLRTLHQWLGLDSALLRRLLAQAANEGLVAVSELSEPEEQCRWRLTSAGYHALETGEYSAPSHERRVFHFLSTAGSPPRHEFVNLVAPDLAAAPNDLKSAEEAKTAPNADLLATWIEQPLKWKQERCFPVEIVEIVTPTQAQAEAVMVKPLLPAWQRVMVIRPVQGLFLFVNEVERLRTFAIKPEGWRIQANPACLVLHDGDWQTLVPAIAEEPAIETWRAAWIAWGQAHSLPESDVRSAEVVSKGFHLRVRVGKRLADRLRVSRSDAITGDAWVWAGDGPIRAVRVLEIAEP
jgi:hypothetical protein